jgi:hypothetical protein
MGLTYMGAMFAVFRVFVVNNELKLFAYAMVAHNQLQVRLIKRVLKDGKVEEKAIEHLNPHIPRRRPPLTLLFFEFAEQACH